MQILDDPISVEALMHNESLQPQNISWRQQTYTVIGLGRQWVGTDGKHILVENHDGSRMELVYNLELGWRLHRYWAAIINV